MTTVQKYAIELNIRETQVSVAITTDSMTTVNARRYCDRASLFVCLFVGSLVRRFAALIVISQNFVQMFSLTKVKQC